jgi:DNA-binding FadR family transcriptional regulator
MPEPAQVTPAPGAAWESTLPRLGGPRLSGQVVQELERRILLGDLAPGQRLPTEAELSELLGVSRSVIRDATRTLATRGLVEIRQGHGMTVTKPDDVALAEAMALRLLRSDLTVADLMLARAALEISLVPPAAHSRTQDDLDAIRGHLHTMSRAVAAEDWPVATSEHLAFHLALLAARHLPALDLLLKPMQQTILLTSRIDGVPRFQTEEHERILDGIRRRDEEATREAIEAHFAYIQDPSFADYRLMRLNQASTVELFLNELSKA